jgi:hypothetical protein
MGLYKLNALDPCLKAPGFNPCGYKVGKNWFQ